MLWIPWWLRVRRTSTTSPGTGVSPRRTRVAPVALAIVEGEGQVAGLVVSCGEVASSVDAGYDPADIWAFGRFFFQGGEQARPIQTVIARAAASPADALAGALCGARTCPADVSASTRDRSRSRSGSDCPSSSARLRSFLPITCSSKRVA